METEECPRCGHMNNSGEQTCHNCHSPTYERYVDCYVCGGTGNVQIDYTDDTWPDERGHIWGVRFRQL